MRRQKRWYEFLSLFSCLDSIEIRSLTGTLKKKKLVRLQLRKIYFDKQPLGFPLVLPCFPVCSGFLTNEGGRIP